MNLQYYYWYFKAALPKSFCEDLIKYGNEKTDEIALTGGFQIKGDNGKKLNEKELKNLKEKRDSNVVWLNEKWVYREIQPFIHAANKNSGWNFQWDWSESCQFTKYKEGQYYDWHCDSWDKPYDKDKGSNVAGKIRKLSVTCTLSKPEDYEGGDLEFDTRQYDPKEGPKFVTSPELREQGSIVVFPSFVWHRVKPVTRGIRNSIVIWNLGDPWV
jgi:PKHD-type hydroxylase|tara:strand:- start:2629 stop:3270 length:642 start_codon:yes stop_codon:yes gene_type:complete